MFAGTGRDAVRVRVAGNGDRRADQHLFHPVRGRRGLQHQRGPLGAELLDRARLGGNGILSGFIPGQGQQAYIGFAPPDPGSDQLYVWRPINFNPLAAGLPVINFSVLMRIADSSNTNYDYFRWSTYNMQGDRLFSIEFDVYALVVNYQLNGTQFRGDQPDRVCPRPGLRAECLDEFRLESLERHAGERPRGHQPTHQHHGGPAESWRRGRGVAGL